MAAKIKCAILYNGTTWQQKGTTYWCIYCNTDGPSKYYAQSLTKGGMLPDCIYVNVQNRHILVDRRQIHGWQKLGRQTANGYVTSFGCDENETQVDNDCSCTIL